MVTDSVAILTQSVFFFFQAEDGIRDLTVTGVQTCALPICEDDGSLFCDYFNVTDEGNFEGENILNITEPIENVAKRHGVATEVAAGAIDREIGRASCRERV